jgi:[acyl-carrier-protein] S-malonyltransferase
MKTIYLFAGQGSQYLGMGKDFYDKFPYLHRLYDQASEILGYDIKEICFERNDLLNITEYTQPAILVTSCAIYEVLKRDCSLPPVAFAGFSLGEYSALYAAGIFDFQTIIELIKYRAQFMAEAAHENLGSMAAIIGLDKTLLERICLETGVWIANYNCSNQIVISGAKDKIMKAIEKAKDLKARRAVLLNVSGAFHTPLMESAALKMQAILEKVPVKKPSFPVIMNYNAQPLELDSLKELMVKQIVSPVRFEETIQLLMKYNGRFLEIGPGKVLSGFLRRINPEMESLSIENINDLNKMGEKDEFTR